MKKKRTAHSNAESRLFFSSLPDFLESIILQNAARPLPRHEWAVALKAPGRYEMGSAPMLLASTTANAEFCIPVSIDIVRDVRSERPNASLGTMYPEAKPNE